MNALNPLVSALPGESLTDLDDAQRRVLDAIDEHALIADLVELIRVPSVTGTDAESDLVHQQANRLGALGFDVDAWKLDLDELAARPDHPGTEAPRTEAYGVVGTLGGAGSDSEPALVLQGHVDVVPTGDLDKWPERDPWSGAIRDGIVHGRGACDMKAGVAANLAVARALAVSGVGWSGRSRSTASSARRTAGSARSRRCCAGTAVRRRSSPSRRAGASSWPTRVR